MLQRLLGMAAAALGLSIPVSFFARVNGVIE